MTTSKELNKIARATARKAKKAAAHKEALADLEFKMHMRRELDKQLAPMRKGMFQMIGAAMGLLVLEGAAAALGINRPVQE